MYLRADDRRQQRCLPSTTSACTLKMLEVIQVSVRAPNVDTARRIARACSSAIRRHLLSEVDGESLVRSCYSVTLPESSLDAVHVALTISVTLPGYKLSPDSIVRGGLSCLGWPRMSGGHSLPKLVTMARFSSPSIVLKHY